MKDLTEVCFYSVSVCQLQYKESEIDLFLCLCGNCTMKDLTEVCFCSVSVCQLQYEKSETDLFVWKLVSAVSLFVQKLHTPGAVVAQTTAKKTPEVCFCTVSMCQLQYEESETSVWELLYDHGGSDRSLCLMCPCLCRNRIPLVQWWLKLRPLLRIMAKHTAEAYSTDVELAHVSEVEAEGDKV